MGSFPNIRLIAALAVVLALLLAGVLAVNPHADRPSRAQVVQRVAERPGIEDLSHHDPPSAGTRDQLPCTAVDEPTNFDRFSVGRSFQAHPVRYTVRQCKGGATAHRIRTNDVVSVYGTCTSRGDSGCIPPLSVETWPACQRSLADYEAWTGRPYPHSRPVSWSHGAVSVSFDGGTRVEVYTGRSTIVFFGNDPQLVASALGSLRREPRGDRVSNPVTSATGAVGIDALPAPVPGALTGRLSCRT
jgi:hypothetical protein